MLFKTFFPSHTFSGDFLCYYYIYNISINIVILYSNEHTIKKGGILLQTLIMNIVNNWGYFGVASLIAIENIFPPIPSEVILTFGGFLTLHSTLNILGVIIASTLGSVIGAIILYMIGKLLSKERLYKIVEGSIGKTLHFKKDDIDNSEKWFLEKGKYTVFFCRFIPIVRSLISIPAGMTKMNFSFFLILTLAGSSIWNTILVILGAFAGEAWESISNSVNMFSKVVLIILVVGFSTIAYLFYKIRIKKKKVLKK